MKIKKNMSPTLPICKMNCDEELHPKLNKFDLTKFMNCSSSNLLLGVPGSGKTNLLYQMIKSKHLLNKCYDKIYLFQPSESRASMKDKLFDKLPEDQKFEELTLENLESVKDRLNEDENSVILFDDMGAYLKDNDVRKLLKELMMNRRHLHVSLFFLAQTYHSVDKEVRRLFSNIFIFKVTKDTMTSIFDELVESKKKYADEIVTLVYDKPYQYLFININTQRMFKGFDEIIF
jgi:hypothetical protein